MKKRLLTPSLIVYLLIQTVGLLITPVKAQDFATETDSYGYTYSCGDQFEVDYIKDDGTFQKKGCYLNIEDAKTKMKENDDYVVRYKYARSPMRIVAMNGGLVYGFPGRKGSATISVYENADETGISTYTSTGYEMVYDSTSVIVTSGNYKGYGILKVNLNGFDGYTDLELVDLVPFKFIDDEISCYIGKDSSTAKTFIPRQNYFIAKTNGNYTDLYINYALGAKHSSANDATQSGEMLIGAAPVAMQINRHYYSKDGITFYTDNHYTNVAFTNYNYFQFLSVRSVASISKNQINGYLERKNKTTSAFYGDNAQAFIDGQNTYGMNALLVFALACNESSYGTSLIKKNNIFGLGAYDSAPGENAMAFDSIADCINSFEGWHLAKYCDYYYGDSSFQYYTAPYFGNKGIGISVKYMSDPYECYKVAGIAYDFDKYINNYDGSYTNYNQYDLALVNKKNVSFYAQADTSGNVLYKSYAGAYTTYQKDCVVTVLDSDDDFARVISGNPISSKRKIIKTTGMTVYNHNNSYAYVEINKLTPLNNDEMFIAYGDFIYSINELSLSENGLIIKAEASMENMFDTAVCSLLIQGKKDTKITLDCTQIDENISIDATVPLNDLSKGSYTLKLSVKYPNHKSKNQSIDLYVEDIPASKVISERLYSFRNSNEKTMLVIADVKEEYASLLSLKELNLSINDDGDTVLYMKGIGAIKGVDSLKAGQTEHELILKNMVTDEEVVVEMDNTASVYSINDGYYYNECGFETSIVLNDITDFSCGSYTISVRTSLESISTSDYLKTMNVAYANIYCCKEEGLAYRISINDLYLNRLEIDVMNPHSELDYSAILKKEERTSFTNITSIEFEEDILSIDSAVMIYYLNYDNTDNLSYTAYLVDDMNDTIIEMNTVMIDNKYDYQSNFRSSYNMDHISVSSCIDVNNLMPGDYRIVVKVVNNENEVTYLDYVNLIQKFEIERPTYETEDNEYSFYVSDIRDQLILKVSEKDEILPE